MDVMRWTIRGLAAAWVAICLNAGFDLVWLPYEGPGLVLIPVLALAVWVVYCICLLAWRGNTAWPETLAIGVMLLFPFVGLGATIAVGAGLWALGRMAVTTIRQRRRMQEAHG